MTPPDECPILIGWDTHQFESIHNKDGGKTNGKTH